MSNPVSSILKQGNTGFTVGKKVALTLGLGLYLLSPLDLVPEFLFPPIGLLDDGVALYMLFRVWTSPTLRSGRYWTPPSPPSPPIAASVPARAEVPR